MTEILYVDNDPNYRSIMTSALETRLGFAVEAASSGNEAIRLLEHGARFDFIISEYEMNDGNGAELFDYLVQKRIVTFFYLFTNDRLDTRILKEFRQGIFQGVIRKSTVTNLCAAILFSRENCSP